MIVGEPVRCLCVEPHPRYALEAVVRILHFPAVAILDSRQRAVLHAPRRRVVHVRRQRMCADAHRRRSATGISHHWLSL